MTGARTRCDPKRMDSRATVFLLRREDASISPAFHTEIHGSLVISIKSPEGRLHLEAVEETVERR